MGVIHRFQGGDGGWAWEGFLCTVLDKELRVKVHGEQTLVIFDDETGEPA